MALRLKNDASRIPFTAWWPQGAGGYIYIYIYIFENTQPIVCMLLFV